MSDGGAEIAYLGLGSNLGDRSASIEEACARLRAAPGIVGFERSPVYETAPVGGPPQSAFLNAAARVVTTLTPQALLACCLAIETAMGRVRSTRNAPRIIDLDVLVYGDRIVSERDLVIPHPLLAVRRFVLAPLADLAPELIPPGASRPVRELLAGLDASDDWVRRIPG